MDNKPTAEEERGAKRWLLIVGLLAIFLVITLSKIDNALTTSDREVRLNNTLKEIRSAQASFETRNVDHRLLVARSVHESD